MSVNQRIITGIILAVLAWGLWLAVGAYVNYRPNHNPWRPVVVLACVLGFVAFWLVMLQSRKKRTRQPKDDV